MGTALCPANLYSGILNVHSTLPEPEVIKSLPSTGDDTLEKVDDAGVINEDTFLPSKNAWIFVPGLKQNPVTVIVLGLIKGIRALEIILLPWDAS